MQCKVFLKVRSSRFRAAAGMSCPLFCPLSRNVAYSHGLAMIGLGRSFCPGRHGGVRDRGLVSTLLPPDEIWRHRASGARHSHQSVGFRRPLDVWTEYWIENQGVAGAPDPRPIPIEFEDQRNHAVWRNVEPSAWEVLKHHPQMRPGRREDQRPNLAVGQYGAMGCASTAACFERGFRWRLAGEAQPNLPVHSCGQQSIAKRCARTV